MTKQPLRKGLSREAKCGRRQRMAGRALAYPSFFWSQAFAWVVAFKAMDPNSRWGQVVGNNRSSQWTQILGLVLMTKRLMEVGSKAR